MYNEDKVMFVKGLAKKGGSVDDICNLLLSLLFIFIMNFMNSMSPVFCAPHSATSASGLLKLKSFTLARCLAPWLQDV